MTAGKESILPPGNPDPLTVRRARLGDAGAILEISSGMGIECNDGEFALHLGDLLKSSDNEIFVAMVGVTMAGWVHVFTARRVGMAGFAEIGGLVTRRAFRRRGVGQLLVRQCATWARRNHRSRLRVRCNARREGAHEFYEKIGFARVKDQVVYEKCP